MTCGCALSFHILCIDVLEKNDIFLVFVFSEDVLCSKQMAIVIFSQVINAPYVYISSRGQWFKSPTGNSLILNLHGVQVQLKVYIYIYNKIYIKDIDNIYCIYMQVLSLDGSGVWTSTDRRKRYMVPFYCLFIEFPSVNCDYQYHK